MKTISQFRFKQFSVWHHRSALKVGVDGVLIACWAAAEGADRILDVGTGCGLIALIMAQRQPGALVSGIEIDPPSVEEARENVSASPWSGRVDIICGSFPDALTAERGIMRKYDLIVSNPPFFDSGVVNASTPRERARHQGTLSPASLLEDSREFLADEGSLAMIVPTEHSAFMKEEAGRLGYRLSRECLVRGHSEAPFKRVMLQWRFRTNDYEHNPPESTELTLELAPGIPTYEYRELCKDFYLKF